ncbi:endoplasmic reticulum transmembrane helix translocase-like isoform X2 [Oscarella lobularis]|uniref:endoplasmic reticulum transmembrane helix translocase-like isoform X2 n=1 Tax=Oscarella lobularis TaxID=121494 RepID=UPI003313247B
MESEFPVSEDVQSIRLLSRRALWMHLNIGPFGIAYATWAITVFGVYGKEETNWEVSLIALAAMVVVQLLASLFCLWSVHVNSLLRCRAESDVSKATLVKVTPTPNNGFPELVSLRRTESTGESRYPRIWFEFQKMKYVYDAEEKKRFEPVDFPTRRTMREYVESRGYENDEQIEEASKKFGKNRLDIEPPDFWALFYERATAPFFVFQVFCVSLWCLDEYWYYSLFTLAMLVVFEATLVKQQQKNLSVIRDMGLKPYTIQVYREKKWKSLQTDELLPGDLISIGRSKEGDVVPCDLLLLKGPCIVDEAMLTGESVPQMKEPVENRTSDDELDVEKDQKLHVIFGGTKVVQHTAPSKDTDGIRPSNNGCLAYVLRTGFNTSQGKLLRTILYSVKRVTANNLETFGFILFLLFFAIISATYVWTEGTKDPNRNRYKLFLQCTLILTCVVPPELPIELSLAVNTSLIALTKLGIFCTEPFRIPFGGKLDVCCFDKTGTLTSDNLVVKGIAGINENVDTLVAVSDASNQTSLVLASCHSLVQLDEGSVGDPLEKAALKAVDWSISRGDIVTPRKGLRQSIKILHRFHFSSALKRMSCVVSHQKGATGETFYMATVKGAPEMIKGMLKKVPENYDAVHQRMSQQGARILALAYKELAGEMSTRELRELRRDDVERDLDFAGFLVISCPLKDDSKMAIKDIRKSSHHVTMITGDNPLTACHVSSELKITSRTTLILKKINDEWTWEAIDQSVQVPCVPERGKKSLTEKYDLCLTGEAMMHLANYERKFFNSVLPSVKVFARVSPKQKEQVITTLRDLGYYTLMCGDGTNDVGALKHAHVGVALLTSTKTVPKRRSVESSVDPSPPKKDPSSQQQPKLPAEPRIVSAGKLNRVAKGRVASNRAADAPGRKKLEKLLKELDEETEAPIVKLGDASIASPFTSKSSSPKCIAHVIKQGRCTLVTTLQMFKILALNALIAAYSQSVLYLDGIKFSDSQATCQGMLLAVCFLFISRSQPLTTLSKERPLPNIFNVYTLLTVCLQFAAHFGCLFFLVKESKALLPPSTEEFVDLEKDFEMTVLNSTVFLIGMTMQVSTFAVNYKGHPFMASLRENKVLLYAIVASYLWIVLLASGVAPDLASQFEIVEFPPEFQKKLVLILGLDCIATLVIDRTCQFLFGRSKLRAL